MAVVKILARRGGLKNILNYVMNRDKTEERLLVTANLCTPDFAYESMMDTKERFGQTGGVQCYHMMQSFLPGEVTPEEAMEIAQEMVREHFPDYEAVIAIHVDRYHIHAHTVINSVNWETGKKYHSNRYTLQQLRETSDRLCRERGLSVIKEDQHKGMSYVEWKRQQSGLPTYRSMLMADLEDAIQDAVDIGDFFRIMEDKGYEIKHGNRLAFRFYGQEHFMVPERKDPRYSEENIRLAVDGYTAAFNMGTYIPPIREPYRPYRPHMKYKGFLALYWHWRYILGNVEKRRYPPRKTEDLYRDIMKFERIKEQFRLLHKYGIETEDQMHQVQSDIDNRISDLINQRRDFNYRKKKRRPLYKALSDEASLAAAAQLCEAEDSVFQEEYEKYKKAKEKLDRCGVSREELAAEKAAVYKKAADLNRTIRQLRREQKLCAEIVDQAPAVQEQVEWIDQQECRRGRNHIQER